MDRLLDSFKIDDSRVYSIMYFFIFLLVLVIISVAVGTYLMFRNGQSFSQLLSIIPSLPTIAINYYLYFFGIMIFIIIITMLIRSQSAHNHAINDNQPIVLKPTIFWKPESFENSFNPMNLRVTSTEWHSKNCDSVTLGVEMIIFNSRSSISTNPYRHILHRGSADLFNYKGKKQGSLIESGGIDDGLPSEMSPGIFIDRFTNDLIVFVDTDPIDNIYSSVKKSFRESIRINDLPLNKAFYVHLVINNKVLEVYINCKLAGTKVLHGKLKTVENEWYGRTGFPAQAVVQNLNLWDGPVNTFELTKLCSKQIVIKKELADLASFNCTSNS